MFGDLHRLVEQFGRRHHPAHQVRALGLLGIDAATGETKLHGLRLADCARQPLGTAVARHDAERDLRLAEYGGIRRQNDVARHGQLAAAAQRIAGHRRDDRLAACTDLVERREKIAAIGFDEILLVHLLDVYAGGKRLLIAGDDDAADRGVGLEDLERAVELADELRVESVERMRAVKRDEPDFAVACDEDGFVGAVLFRRLLGFRFSGGEDVHEHVVPSPLALTGWTIKGGASSLDGAAYGSSAAFSGARLALAVISLEAMLKAAEPAVGALVVAQRRAAGLDGIRQHGLDGGDQSFRFFGGLARFRGQRAGALQRRNAGAMQRLAGVDVAEAGDQFLVEQRRLDRGGLAFEARREPFGRKGGAERLDAEALEQSVLVEPLGPDQVHQPEAPRVGVTHLSAVAEMKHDMLMLRHFPSRLLPAGEPIGMVDAEAPGHAEMHHQHFAVVEPGEQIFGAPVERLYLPPGQPRAEILGQRNAQIGAPLLDARERVADQHGLQSPAHGFHLG